jgi:type IV secretion system protein TrbI
VGISEKTILEPEQPKPGIPLRRSTVIVLFVALLVSGLIASLFFSVGGQRAAQTAEVKDANELKQVGTAAAIEGEKQDALRKEGLATGAEQSTLAGPLPRDGVPRAPAGVRRDDNSGALYAKGFRPGVNPPPSAPASSANASTASRPGANNSASRDPAIEQDAQARVSKSVVLDDNGKADVTDPGAFLRTSATQTQPTQSPAVVQPPSAAVGAQLDALKAQLAAGGQKRSSDWVKEYAQDVSKNKRQVLHWDEPVPGLVLRKGKIIPAVTERQINSDLPGTITARVRENVYDASGNLLVPMGAALVGKYDAQIKVGQERVLIAFEDLILPNGVSFRLPAATGSDLSGAAGVTGDVDNHFFKMFGTSLLIAVLADGTKQPASVSAIGGSAITSAGQVLADTSRTILDRNRNISPTISVAQGTRINVEVVADMQFPSAYYPDKRVSR